MIMRIYDMRIEANARFLKARDIVLSSDGIEQTRALAQEYADKAIRLTREAHRGAGR